MGTQNTMTEYSSNDVSIYLNAINRTMARKGVTKEISDEFWTNDIVPILYPLWDSDRDKLESFIRYEDGKCLVHKNKFQRNQKTGEYKWVSYEFNLSGVTQEEIDDLYKKLEEKYLEYRGLIDFNLESQLAKAFANDNIVTWHKVLMVRKFLLDDSDWTQVSDAPISDENKELWKIYRQKLRDIPQQQIGIPANFVRYPITPSKFNKMNEESDQQPDEYLSDLDNHYYNLTNSVYSKFSQRIVTYLTLALQSGQIDSIPTSTIFKVDNSLDTILRSIENGGFE